MGKKVISLFLCLGLLLSGCQLAQPEATKTNQGDTSVQPDQLAGV